MKAKGYITILAVLATFTLTGCETISQAKLNQNYVAKEKVEKQIEELKESYINTLAQKNEELADDYEKKINALMAQMQGGANSLYGANEGYKYYEKPSRLDTIINNRVTEAQAALGVSPTYDAVVKENERMKAELDEKKTTIEDLRKKHNEVLGQNIQLVEETKKATKELDAKKQDIDNLKTDYNKTKDELVKKDQAISNQIIQREHERGDEEKTAKELKQKLMLWTGIAALAATVGAIYSPVGKRGLVILAATLGGATAAIPFIQGWMVLVGVLGVAGVIIGKWLYDHHVTDRTNDNLINAIEDTKTTPNATVDTLKSNLKAWNSKYVSQKGDTLLAKDHSVEKLIQSKLAKFGRLDPKTPPSGSSST